MRHLNSLFLPPTALRSLIHTNVSSGQFGQQIILNQRALYCGCYLTASFAQAEKERGVVKDQLLNSKSKNYTEEDRFRVRERHWLRNWAISLIVSNYWFGGSRELNPVVYPRLYNPISPRYRPVTRIWMHEPENDLSKNGLLPASFLCKVFWDSQAGSVSKRNSRSKSISVLLSYPVSQS